MRAAWPGPGLSPCALRFPSWDLPQTLPSVFPHCRPIKDPPGHTGSIVVLSLVDHAKPSYSGTRAVRSTAHAVCCRALCCSGPPRGEGSGDSLLRRSANAPASCSRRGTCCLQTPKTPTWHGASSSAVCGTARHHSQSFTLERISQHALLHGTPKTTGVSGP